MREIWWGVYAGVVSNLAVVLVSNNSPYGDPSPRTWLVTVGASNEVLGVLLVASPELVPRARLVARWSPRHVRAWRARVGQSLRKLLRLPGRAHFVSVHDAIDVESAIGLDVTQHPPAGDDVEERLSWLIDKAHKHEERLKHLERTSERLPERWQADMAEMREGLEGLQRDLVRSLADRNIWLRLLGLLYVVVGLIVSVIGNLI